MKQNICKAVVYSLLTMASVNAAAAGLFKPSSTGSNSILQSRQALAGQLNLSANRQRFDLLKGSDGKFTNQMQKFDGYSKGAMGTTGKAADLQNSSSGPNIGGGGYAYFDSSSFLLKESLGHLKDSFRYLIEEDFEKINSYFQQHSSEFGIKNFIPVTIESLKKDFENIRYSFFMQVNKVNPNGAPEPLLADYFIHPKSGKGFVILLPLFFQKFNNGDQTKNINEMGNILLHEIAHLYGVGIEDNDKNNDSLAEVWANKVGAILSSMYNVCGNAYSATQSEAYEECKLIGLKFLQEAGQDELNRYNRKNESEIIKDKINKVQPLFMKSFVTIPEKNPEILSVIALNVSSGGSFYGRLSYINEYELRLVGVKLGNVIRNSEGVFYVDGTRPGMDEKIDLNGYNDSKADYEAKCIRLSKIKYLGFSKWEFKRNVYHSLAQEYRDFELKVKENNWDPKPFGLLIPHVENFYEFYCQADPLSEDTK